MIRIQNSCYSNLGSLNTEILLPKSQTIEKIQNLASTTIDTLSTYLTSSPSAVVKKTVAEEIPLTESHHVTITPLDIENLCKVLKYAGDFSISNITHYRKIEAFFLQKIDIYHSVIKEINTLLETLKKDGPQIEDLGKENIIYIKEIFESISPGLFDKLQSLTAPPDTKIDDELREVTAVSGIYNENELTEYFYSLRKALQENPSKGLIYFTLSNHSNKKLRVGYDPVEKSWVLMDPNSLIIEKISEDSLLVKKVFSSLCLENNTEILISNTAWCLEESLPDFQEKISTWKNTDEYKKIQTVTPEKAHFVINDISWLSKACGFGDVESVQMLLKTGADINLVNFAGWTPLIEACSQGYTEIVKMLLKAGADINLANFAGWTPLMVACSQGHTEIAKKLLELNADVNKANANHGTALRLAITNNHIEILPLLYAKGATRTLSHDDLLIFMKAIGYEADGGVCKGIAHKGMEAFLLGEIITFNSRLEKINNLLQEIEITGTSLKNLLGKINNLSLLVEQKMKESHPDLFIDLLAFFDGIQLYQLAKNYHEFFEEKKKPVLSSQQHLDYVKEVSPLASSLRLEALGGIQEIARFSGIYNEKELTQYFEGLKNTFEESSRKNPIIFQLSSINHAISLAYDLSEKTWIFFDANNISLRKITDTSFIAEHVFSAFKPEKDQNVAMSTIAYCTKYSLSPAQEIITAWQNSSKFKKIHEITQGKIKLMSKAFDDTDISWFLIASQIGDLSNIQLLLTAGADIDTVDSKGGTALMIASSNGHTETIKTLLQANAGVNLTDSKIRTPLMYASFNGHAEIVNILLQAGADINLVDSDGWTCLMRASYYGHTETVKTLLDAGVDINLANSKGWTALMCASFKGHTEIVTMLLKAGADPDVSNDKGETALIKASHNNQPEIIQILLEAGADLNKTDEGSCSPLFWAAYSNHIEIAEMLIKAGANIEITNQNGETALTEAASKRHFILLKMLLEIKMKKIFASIFSKSATHNSSSASHAYQDVLSE